MARTCGPFCWSPGEGQGNDESGVGRPERDVAGATLHVQDGIHATCSNCYRRPSAKLFVPCIRETRKGARWPKLCTGFGNDDEDASPCRLALDNVTDAESVAGLSAAPPRMQGPFFNARYRRVMRTCAGASRQNFEILHRHKSRNPCNSALSAIVLPATLPR